MKKIITICLFAFAMVLNTNTLAAQDTDPVRTASTKQTKKLSSKIKTMSSQQTEQIYEAFKNYNKKKAIIDQSSNSENNLSLQNEERLNIHMKKILTAEQFEIFERMFNKN